MKTMGEGGDDDAKDSGKTEDKKEDKKQDKKADAPISSKPAGTRSQPATGMSTPKNATAGGQLKVEDIDLDKTGIGAADLTTALIDAKGKGPMKPMNNKVKIEIVFSMRRKPQEQ